MSFSLILEKQIKTIVFSLILEKDYKIEKFFLYK